jgi:predicted solute-binding protein
VTKLRISVVQYLNTAPLIRGFTHGPLRSDAAVKYDLSFTVPSQCAEALRTGAADVAIIPAIEYQCIVSQGIPLTILPNLAIASKERVRSLLLISKIPIRQARRIALDPSSRSTQALVKILAARHWQISPQFFEPTPPRPRDQRDQNGERSETILAAMLADANADADAALIIGDAALQVAIAAEAQGAKPGPDGEWITSSAALNSLVAAQYIAPSKRPLEASSAESPIGAQHRCAPTRQDVARELQSSSPLHIYDIVTEWRRLTNLPAVLAIWAARNDSFPNSKVPADRFPTNDLSLANVIADFQASRDFGLTQIPQIAAEAAAAMHLPENDLRLYLEKNIDYSLDAENLQALHRFFQESQALNLIPALNSITIAPDPIKRVSSRA